MEKQNKAIAKVAITILSKLSAISAGVAFFDKAKEWAFLVAVVAALIAFALAWRTEQ